MSCNRLCAEAEKFQKELRFIAASVTRCRVAPAARLELFLRRRRAGAKIARRCLGAGGAAAMRARIEGREPPIAK